MSVLDHAYWVLGSTAGALFGSLLTVDLTGLDFVMTAMFFVIFLQQWSRDGETLRFLISDHMPALIGVLGSNYYNAKTDNTAFPIGFYLRSQDGIGEYSFTIAYDGSRLHYEDGATPAGDSLITVSGNGNGAKQVKTLIAFSATSGGESGIKFVSADVKDSDGADMTVSTLAEAPVHITGDDTSNKNFEDVLSEAEKAANPDAAGTDENAEGTNGSGTAADGANENEAGTDENADGKAAEGENAADAEVSDDTATDGIDDDYDINADTYRESASERQRKVVTVVIIVILVILLIIILFFINKLLHEGKELSDDSPKKKKKQGNAVERDEFDDSDDDGIWDDIKRKPRE